MSYTSTGMVVHLSPTELVGQNGLPKRTLVIEVQDGQYKKSQPFVLLKERAEKANYIPGQQVTVHWDYQGREWNGKWFADAIAWKVEVQGQAGSVQQQQPAPFHPDNKLDSEEVPF